MFIMSPLNTQNKQKASQTSAILLMTLKENMIC